MVQKERLCIIKLELSSSLSRIISIWLSKGVLQRPQIYATYIGVCNPICMGFCTASVSKTITNASEK